LREEGFIHSAKWFQNAERMWDTLKTEKSERLTCYDRINYQRGLTEQNINSKFMVLYNTSGMNANSVVIDRRNFNLEFVVDYKSFVIYLDEPEEAYYLTAFLNSAIPNKLMKDFQSRGLFGARDVSKKILDIYFPKFDETDETHLHLSELGKAAHEKAAQYLKDNPPQNELSAIHLGRLRLDIKKHLSVEMKEIDKIVKKLIG
jgi:hypothetical protein